MTITLFMYTENSTGDSIPPCLTPHSKRKSHLKQSSIL